MSQRFVGLILCLTAIPGCVRSGFGQYKNLDPQVSRVVASVSAERITETLKALEGFGTRNIFTSQEDPKRGVGAARRWIFEQLRGYSPRLEVSYDQYRVKKIAGKNTRVPRDVDLYNIVATLPGQVHPEQRILITAHYDTLVLAGPTGASTAGGETTPMADPETDAPGVTDDASGVACVLELARILSQYEFDKTLVFIAFAGEEEGLLGSTLYAAKAKHDGQKIEALLNNDIIGFETSGNGRIENHRVSVFSDDPSDSPSRTVARYVRDIGERYVPSMQVRLEFRADRVARGGDHTPFSLEGFGAVRFSSPVEDYSHEHTSTDTFEHTSPSYIARVTQLNGAIAASLAWAPAAPAVSEEVDRDGQKTTRVFLNRGESRYAAQMSWKHDQPEADLAGYAVVMRPTTAPYWEREIFVGPKTEYVLPDVSIDEWIFGVKAIDKDGNESLAVPFVPPARTKRVIEVY
jgi:hypothetical protein